MTMLEWLRRIPADLCWTEDRGSHAELKIGKLAHEAAMEIERLRKIEAAARALKFTAYPAHGSGFICQVSGGNINDLEAALVADLKE